MGLLQLAVTWYMLEGKLPTGTSKTKRLHQDKFEFSLFWMSQWATAISSLLLTARLQKAHFSPLRNGRRDAQITPLTRKVTVYISHRAWATCGDTYCHWSRGHHARPGGRVILGTRLPGQLKSYVILRVSWREMAAAATECSRETGKMVKESANLPCGYDDDFINPVDDDFQCSICFLPLREPVLARCGHRFCGECLERHMTR